MAEVGVPPTSDRMIKETEYKRLHTFCAYMVNLFSFFVSPSEAPCLLAECLLAETSTKGQGTTYLTPPLQVLRIGR